jgi:DNA-binding NarL/FixJ family response regulator
VTDAETAKVVAESLERIAMVLGALFASQLGDVGQELKIERLSRCGFTNVQIASILGTTPNAVNVGLHRARRARGRRSQRRRRGNQN